MLMLNNARSWLSRRRTMNTLRGLSNETLVDIGLTRFDVARSGRQAR